MHFEDIQYNFLGTQKTCVYYYTFGMSMEGRTYSESASSKYPFGMNGQMKDDEIYGEGNAYSAQYWEYDARLGRRWNLDPVDQISISNYACFGNNPILRIDPNGDDDYSVDEKGKVTKVGDNKKSDNYYALGEKGIQKDENGKITNSLITSTKAGALSKINNDKMTYTDKKGEHTIDVQSLDFGDNADEANQVFEKISDYSNKEFSYSRYNSNYGDNGKNMVYTSFKDGTEMYGPKQTIMRWNQLEYNTHFHPEEKSYNKYLDRYNPSDEDIDFKDMIKKQQNISRKFDPKIPSAQFNIYAGPFHSLINYTNATK